MIALLCEKDIATKHLLSNRTKMLPFPRKGEGKSVTLRYIIIKERGPGKFKGWGEVKIVTLVFFTNNNFYALCFVLFSVQNKK